MDPHDEISHVAVQAVVLHDMDDKGKVALMITMEVEQLAQADLDSLLLNIQHDSRVILVSNHLR